MNTFQATLRNKLSAIDQAIVAQRLKRTPSIVSKPRRFEGMSLARMQDIAGLRAVVADIPRVRALEKAYRQGPFKHKLVDSKDYIANPKADGYRSVHLIFQYENDRAPAYNGLSLEMQFRTQRQHYWATSVETMGTFLGQALKSGQGETQWRDFFTTASAALALVEGTPAVPGHEGMARATVFRGLAEAEGKLGVLEKLQAFAVAADRITKERGQGAYHLVILDSAARSVSIRPYAISRLEEANRDYALYEQKTKNGESIEAVLVSAGPVDALRKAYPNYFLDTAGFIQEVRQIIDQVK